MRKKLTAIAMGLVVLLVFTACGGSKQGVVDEAAKAKLNEGLQKTATLKSQDQLFFMDVTMKAGSKKLEMKTDYVRQTNLKDLKNPEMRIKMNQEVDGETSELDMYYKGGYTYMVMSGKKIKIKMPYEEIATTVESAQSSIDIVNLKEASFLNLTMEQEGDDINYRFTVDHTKGDVLKDIKEGAMNGLKEQTGDAEIEVTELKGTAKTNKEGYLSEQNVDITMKLKSSGAVVEAKMNLNLKYNNAGKEVSVEPFSNLNSFIEVDRSLFE